MNYCPKIEKSLGQILLIFLLKILSYWPSKSGKRRVQTNISKATLSAVQVLGRTARAGPVVNAETTLQAVQQGKFSKCFATRLALHRCVLQELWPTEEIHGQHNGEATGRVLLQRNGVANQIIHNSTSSLMRCAALRSGPGVYLHWTQQDFTAEKLKLEHYVSHCSMPSTSRSACPLPLPIPSPAPVH